MRWNLALRYGVPTADRFRSAGPDAQLDVETAQGNFAIRLSELAYGKIQHVLDEQGHALLYCHSPAREQKDRAIDAAKAAGFEAVLLKLVAGLSKPRGTKDVAKIMERLGRAKQRFARAAQHYQVEVTKDDTGTQVRAITWTKRLKPGSASWRPSGVPHGSSLRRSPSAPRSMSWGSRSNRRIFYG